MKHKNFLLLLIFIMSVSAGLFLEGCGGGKSSRSGVPSASGGAGGTGGGTGGGGTGTGTGGGGNGGGGDPGSAERMNIICKINQSGGTEAIREMVAERFRTEFAPEVWTGSEGNMYIGDVSLQFGTDDGQVNIWFSHLSGPYIGGGTTTGMGMKNWMQVSVECFLSAFMHEWGHAFMGRSQGEVGGVCEEYSCTPCYMASTPPTLTTHDYCDDSTCKTGNPCWSIAIPKRWPNFKRNSQPGACPAPVIHLD